MYRPTPVTFSLPSGRMNVRFLDCRQRPSSVSRVNAPIQSESAGLPMRSRLHGCEEPVDAGRDVPLP